MGRFSQRTPPVKSISQVGLLIMLVPLFFLIFFASCIHVETIPYFGMGDTNAENMNVNMNDVDMSIGGRPRDAFGGSGDYNDAFGDLWMRGGDDEKHFLISSGRGFGDEWAETTRRTW